ncbi:CaiB/BaiF CoA transferase family protein [Piscinibacter sakaiensis]|uniref:CaiB/BaiF CoA transferase family protein n=1 Tax=Piscinibacter sakaiensis TaxID=1547922 RepID=UPI003AAADA55
MSGPLSHLRILDLSRILAGPWCTQMLADLGADVIKVERPEVGDDSRHWGPPFVPGRDGPTADASYFTSTNRNKRSLALDIATPAAQQLLRELARECDVFVENFKVGDLDRYGLGYDDMRAVNPRIVYCSITGYGQDGPYAKRPGYDFMAQGEGGLMSINGHRDDGPGGGPVKVAIAVTDILTGMNATVAILAAVERRHISGQGQRIDLALLDSIVHFGSNQIVGMFASGEIPGRWGNEHPNLAPYQVFRSANGHFVVGAGNDGQFRRLCGVIGREALATDPRFRTVAERNKNRPALIEELQRVMETQDTAHWVEQLAAINVPSAPINDYKQVFEHPQVLHRQLRIDQAHGGGGVVSTVANPIRFSATPIEYRIAPPLLGEHSIAVLADLLGKTPGEIDRLVNEGIVGRPPTINAGEG